MARIAWTDDLRAELSPRDASTLKPIDANRAWARGQSAFKGGSVFEALKKSLSRTGALEEATKGVLATLTQAVVPADATVLSLGASIAVASHLGYGDPVVGAIAAARGAAIAIRALRHGHELHIEHKYPDLWLTYEPSKVPIATRTLREAVLLEGNDVDAIAAAREMWPGAGLTFKVTLAHALPGAPDLAADVAREIAALPPDERLIVAPVLASLRDMTNLEKMLSHRMGAHPLVDAVENFGLDALPVFVALWSQAVNDRIHLARATTCYVDATSAAVLAREIDKKSTGTIARSYFGRHPELTDAAFGELAKTRSKLGEMASELLVGAKRMSETHDEVPLAKLPMVLSRSPWLGDKPKRKLRVLELAPRARPETVTLDAHVRERIRGETTFAQFPLMEGETLLKWVAEAHEGKVPLAWWANRLRIPHEALRDVIAHGYARAPGFFAPQAIGVFGQPALAAFLDWLEKNPTQIDWYMRTDVFLAIESHRLTGPLLDRLEDVRASERAWECLVAHVEATLVGLIPIAVGRRSKRRGLAERVLRKIAIDHDALAREVAASYGDEARASVEEILGFDERYDCPSVAPKMPSAWRSDAFARPRLPDGRALPIEAVDRIGHMLAFSTLDAPYAGLADVRALCEPRSLAELAWDAGRAWQRDGAKPKLQWMVDAIAHFGDDEVIRRTTPAIAEHRIVTVLAYAATPAAAIELSTIASRIAKGIGSAWGTRAAVDAAFAVLARRCGKRVEEIEDSLMPTVTIVEPRVKLDFGSRVIDVGFDERLDPFIESDRGRLRALPKAGKKDDPAKVARAQEIWDELQEDVAAIADVRLHSLERAMATGRVWTLEAFAHAWMDHPLMRHLSRGVIWRAGETTCRIAEDGSFADVHDKTLSEVRELAIAHPAEMTDAVRDAWRAVFVDYKIAQPLEQLSRRTLGVVRGESITLVPVGSPPSLAEIHERFRAAGFEPGWHAREQIATRTCIRSAMRFRLMLHVENKSVSSFTLTAELDGQGIDLERVDPVDLSELVHVLALEPK